MKLQQIRERFEAASREAGHRRNTRKSYWPIIEDYCNKLKSGEVDGPQAYFDHLSSVRELSAKSVWHALNPLKFLYERVLEKEFGRYCLPKRPQGRRIPCELAYTDVIRLLAEMPRLPRLQGGLLAGCGLRVESDMLKLRLKDIHLEDRMLVIQSGKGDKARSLRLPEAIMPELERQVRACRRQWEQDRAAGVICPIDDESLMRKYGRKTFGTLPWYWLFPSRSARNGERWHATDKRLSTALKRAAEELGIMQRVHPHALRHSYATELLRTGTDIRTIQQQLGHSRVETTEIYAHAMGAKGVASPLDRAAPTVIPFPGRGREERTGS